MVSIYIIKRVSKWWTVAIYTKYGIVPKLKTVVELETILLFTTIYFIPNNSFASFIAYLFWKYAISYYLCTKIKKDQWWIKHYNYITLIFFLQEYRLSVSLAACMYIGSVDSSKLPYYFLTGTICWLVSLFTAVFLSDFQADVSSSLKILLCVVNCLLYTSDAADE